MTLSTFILEGNNENKLTVLGNGWGVGNGWGAGHGCYQKGGEVQPVRMGEGDGHCPTGEEEARGMGRAHARSWVVGRERRWDVGGE